MTTPFKALGLAEPLVDTLTRLGVIEPFPIQTLAIPEALAGRDVCGKAPTGSGKTLAFGLPLLARLGRARPGRPRALVVAPTRELAAQIGSDLAPLAEAVGATVTCIYGGVGYGPQRTALRRGVDIVVATPGRLEDLMAQAAVDLGEVDIVVLDEADRMADMGFLPAVRRILDETPRKRQTLLFSATLDGDVAVLSRDYQREPARHEALPVAAVGPPASHRFWLVDHHDRPVHTADLIESEGQSIVFTRTRRGADRLAKQLGRLGVAAVVLHGGRSQGQRTRALDAFSSGRAPALIATDVAARGIHVDSVGAVVHFDPPADAKDYVHRSGRTARAGAPGQVVSLVTEAQRRDVEKLVAGLDLEVRFERPTSQRVPGEGLISVPSSPHPRHRPPSPSAGDAGTGQSVYVGNLPWGVTPDDLRAMFAPFGTVHDTAVVTDRKSGRSRGFGFISMGAAGADEAVRRLHGTSLEGRHLTVRPAQPRSARRDASRR